MTNEMVVWLILRLAFLFGGLVLLGQGDIAIRAIGGLFVVAYGYCASRFGYLQAEHNRTTAED